MWFKMLCQFKDTLKAFDDFKDKQQKWRSNVFWFINAYIFWKFCKNTIHWYKTLTDKVNVTK